MIKNLLCALALGTIASLFVLTQDPGLRDIIKHEIEHSFSQAGNCTMQCAQVSALNFFWPCIELRDVRVNPLHGTEWHWQAKKIRAHCSWWHIVRTGTIDLHLALDTLEVFSTVNSATQQCAIEEHVNALVYGPELPLPLIPQSVTCHNSACSLLDPAVLQARIAWNSTTQKKNDVLETHLDVTDVTCLYKNICYVHHGTAKTIAHCLEGNDGLHITAQTEASLHLPLLSTTPYSIKGNWQEKNGTFACTHNNETLCSAQISLDPDKKEQRINAHVTIPLAQIAQHFIPTLKIPLAGTCSADVAASLNAQGLTAHIHGSLGNNLTFTCSNNKEIWHSIVKAHGLLRGEGSITWNSSTGAGSLNTAVQCVPPLGTSITPPHPQTLKLTGTFNSKAGHASCSGMLDTLPCKADLEWQKNLRIREFRIGNPQKPLLHASTSIDNPTLIACTLDCAQACPYISAATGYQVTTPGTVTAHLNTDDPSSLEIAFKHGALRIPETYNALHEATLTLHYDAEKQTIALTAKGELYKGSVSCNNALVRLNNEYQPTYVYAPVIFDSCMLNVNKDLFTMLSGRLLFTYHENKPCAVRGNCFIEHAHVKENIFSPTLQNTFAKLSATQPNFLPTIMCDVTLETKRPIQVKNAFLETTPKLNIHIGNTLAQPEITGSITLNSGSLLFPYKPLHITKGSLSFVPGQLTNPFIELTAKNSIKKHNVALHITGLLHDPHIMLESSPPLTEEQILSLILVGSHHESLNMIMPALLMHNLKYLLFGDGQSPQAVDRYLKNIFRPFKYVHLIPSFTDQSGRGGLRGALEIELSERLHALIQKNFSLTEDTRFELEYLLSDDVGIRAFRDERRDVGAEVEMRWKF